MVASVLFRIVCRIPDVSCELATKPRLSLAVHDGTLLLILRSRMNDASASFLCVLVKWQSGIGYGHGVDRAQKWKWMEKRNGWSIMA